MIFMTRLFGSGVYDDRVSSDAFIGEKCHVCGIMELLVTRLGIYIYGTIGTFVTRLGIYIDG